MKLNRTVLALLAGVALALPALAQSVTIDKSYEAQKESEIATARLQLATQPGSAAVQELGEADALMRRLKATKPTDQRAKVATELEAAITRLKIAANPVGAR
ncbi:conserved exported hypothetical protein [Magnetospirillum sp. LM-5]|jgi:hypothetical protein|uniref:hypothetical protein n=1 Tax=Magnetospirillum sp. LM-5 TaxID=2681466 RepID=UPI0013839955|nr:hypothetical protein [Magnetospirillum sp. LM-5]CAA7620946.1 conserved exported hypothetical protein [Magnetospirillum sp. LM-5]